MTEKIIALARSLGRVREDQGAALEELCRAAETEMAARLREGVTPQDCGPAFALGCAWLALSWLAGGQGGGVTAFTAGSVSVREEGGGRDRAAALRLQAETVLGPYLKDREFFFQGVEG